MLSIISIDDGKVDESKGRRICEKNEFMQTIMNTGETPFCKKLLNDYCENKYDIKTVFMFLMLYNSISNKYGDKLNKYQKIYLLSLMMKNKDIRHQICLKLQSIFSVQQTSKLIE